MHFGEYESQLYDFRYDDSHDHDDGPDAVAAALVLLDPAAAYFAKADPAEDEYPPLDEEYPTEGEEDTDYNWAS